MKEFLQNWGATLCFAGVATAVLYFLAPDNGMGRLVQITAATVWLLCLFSPLVTVNWTAALTDWPTPLSQSGQNDLLQQRIIEQLKEPLAESVEEQGKQALAAYNLTAEKIWGEMDIDGDGHIYISKIVAELTEKQAVRRLDVREILSRRFGTDVEIREVD